MDKSVTIPSLEKEVQSLETQLHLQGLASGDPTAQSIPTQPSIVLEYYPKGDSPGTRLVDMDVMSLLVSEIAQKEQKESVYDRVRARLENKIEELESRLGIQTSQTDEGTQYWKAGKSAEKINSGGVFYEGMKVCRPCWDEINKNRDPKVGGQAVKMSTRKIRSDQGDIYFQLGEHKFLPPWKNCCVLSSDETK